MRVQNIDLGFGKKPKKDESVKNKNVFVYSIFGASLGGTSGAIAQKYAPISDDFFCKISKAESEKIETVEKTVNEFIENYGTLEINNARLLKTALLHPEIKKALSITENNDINNLINDEKIKIISPEESEELNNSCKNLHAQLKENIVGTNNKEEIEFKSKEIGADALEKLSLAKEKIEIRENLVKYKNEIKGLSQNGTENIRSIKQKISPQNHGLRSAFNKMVRTAKMTQRPVELWVAIPIILSGLLSTGLAANYRLQHQIYKDKQTKKEPQ